MNIIDLQDSLKDLPDSALMQEMQAPTGSAPQFLVLSELKRRKRMRDEFQRQQNMDMPTVAEEVVTAAGMPQQGIMGAARAMAPNTNVAQNTGMDMAASVPATRAPQPQMMADGGVVKMQQGGGFAARPGPMLGGTATAIAMLRENYPEVYRKAVEDGNVEEMAAIFAESATTPELTGLEELEAPRDYDLLQSLFTDPSNRAVSEKQREIAATQDEREIAAQIATQQILRDRADDEGLFAEGSVTEMLAGTPEGGFPRTSEAYGIEGDLVSPELDDYLPPSDIKLPPQDMGIRSLSGFGSIPEPSRTDSATIEGSSTTGFSLEPGSPAETDAIREFLAGGGGRGIRGILDSGLDTTRIREDDLGALEGALTTSPDPIRNLVNRRAQEYLQSDMYTPPEEIYDLGPQGRIKYETEDPAERGELSAAVQQRLFDERQAADAAAEKRMDYLPSMETELRDQRERDLRAEERRMDYLGPVVPDSLSKTLVDAGVAGVEAIGDVISSAAETGADMAIGRKADKSSEVVLGEGAEITPQKSPEAAAAQQEIENLRNQVAELSKSGRGGGTAGEAAVMKALSARQKAAESDKWMALARTGAAIMASKSPTLGGAIGEGLGVGLESLSKSKKQAQDYEIAMAKIKASMARARKSGGLTANQRIDALMELRGDLEQSLLLLPENDPRRLGIDMRIESIDRQIAPYLGVSAGGTGSQKVKIS